MLLAKILTIVTIDTSNSIDETKAGKDLYAYQKGAINKIFTAFEDAPEDYNLLYQLPTGGGKT
ncbi:MAG: superfamily II DNA or RNA helicase, partial [Patiriisocius sp.]